MEKGDARLFSLDTRNIIQLESRIRLRSMIDELILLTNQGTLSRGALHERLQYCLQQSDMHFLKHLVRSLQRPDAHEREALVWLITLLSDTRSVPLLQHMANDTDLPRPVRLSATLALAGIGATAELVTPTRPTRLYAIHR